MTRTFPRPGLSKPASSRARVDLPDPLRPITQTASPGANDKLTLRKAGGAPSRYQYDMLSRTIIDEKADTLSQVPAVELPWP